MKAFHLLLLIRVVAVDGLDNGVAALPRMGWSSFNFFGTTIDEKTVREMADALVANGLRDAGFTFLHLDNGALNISRDAHGRLQENRTLFPSGLRSLSDYLHTRGLKLGVYTDIGNVSCGLIQPGSYGSYMTDAHTFAHDWQVDAIKVDFCDFYFIPEQLDLWRAFGHAFNSTGRPMWLYTSPHSGGAASKVPATGVSAPWHDAHPYAPPLKWSRDTIRGLANSMMFQYVNLFDYWYSEHWKGDGRSPPGGFLTNVDAMVQLSTRAGQSVSGPGFYADAQQLEVCNFGEAGRQGGGMTLEEYRSQYSIWAVFASPLVLSFDARSIGRRHADCLAMVKNRHVLEMAQDSLGAAGVLVHQATNLSSTEPASSARTNNIVEQSWSRHLANGDVALCLFNRGEGARRMNVSWVVAGLPARKAGYHARDLWTSKDLGVLVDGFDATVPPHSVRLVRVSR